MRIIRIVIIIFICLLTVKLEVSGSIHDSAGSSSAQFLRINPGGRIPGLGNAGTSIHGTTESIFYNPSGLGYLENVEINGNYSKWFEQMNYSSLAIGVPIKNIGTFGAGFTGLFYGDIPIVVQDGAGDLSRPGNSTTANGLAFYLSYGRKIHKIFSAGINVKIINLALEEENSTSIGFDLGGMTKLLKDRLGLGFMLQNVGTKAKFIRSEYNLPLIIKFGAGYEALRIKNHTGLIVADIVKPMDDNIKFNFGLEYGFNRMVFIRGGYQVGYDLKNLTIGGGINVPLKENYAGIDYAYVPYGVLGATHRIGLKIQIGRADLDSRDPDIYYYRGADYFIKEDYENALKMWKITLEIDHGYDKARERIKEAQKMIEREEEMKKMKKTEDEFNKYLEKQKDSE